MTQALHQIAQDYFAALSAGDAPAHLLVEDMTAWTTSSGQSQPREKYVGGIRMLGTLFEGGLKYTIDALTAENDRVVAEVHSEGILINGEGFQNRYVFILRVKEGKIVSVAEHFNPEPVRQQIIPLMQAAMARQAG
ncbi:MAG TPA: nuclear transport factor 2 family protein [Sphingobium sp.]|uniref:nuclear transport factor 2 family protein n=1 Tax=Sphingobium sp. TaxID=1912891 RepID=UPI002ED1BB23